MKKTVIIPARMSATRFPGKPLADICGKPMIQWVYERASMAKGVSQVMVATCDSEIIDAVKSFGGEAVMTSDKHRSGTDRLAEAASGIDTDIVINVQGDEPLIEPSSIEMAAEPFEVCKDTQMTSLMVAADKTDAKDPNMVKVVVDKNGNALYFSRSLIPYERKELACKIYGHIGLYAYTKDFLIEFSKMKQTPLELTESLEQLRVLENGYKIKMIEVDEKPFGVDTPEDLDRVRRIISEGKI